MIGLMNSKDLRMDKAEAPAKQEVILIHGTFAASSEDVGTAWWQVGSGVYKALQAKLPPGVKLARQGRVFHWSGSNDERARSKAALELLEFLKPLENAGIKYHLIGHSHGGSVIWTALRRAMVRKTHLQNLLSWSTVGTPFLHHRSRSPLSGINMLNALLGVLLLYPAIKSVWHLARFPVELAQGNLSNFLIIAGHDDVHPVTGILRAPFIAAVTRMGVPFTEVDQGLRIGSFDPDSGASAASFLLGTFEGWLILSAILLFAYVTVLLCSYCIGPVAEVARSLWEKRLEDQAFGRYGKLWLGIWTQDDEAINGLQKTLEISVSFVGKIAPRERIFVSDLVSLPSRPLLWITAPFYNNLVRPILDASILSMVVKVAQGNNRPATEVVAISPHPVDKISSGTIPPLPSWLSARILHDADRHASDLGPKLRLLLGEPSITSGLERLSGSLAGRELVHTSYFDQCEVIDLLSMNIGSCQSKSTVRRAWYDTELVAWFENFKALQVPGSQVSETSLAPEPPVRKQLPRRKAA